VAEFSVGQRVTTYDRIGPLAILTVVRVLIRKMVLSDGSEWGADGFLPFIRKQPADERRLKLVEALAWFGYPKVRPFSPDDERLLQERLDLKVCERFDGWSDMNPALRKVVADAIRQHQEEAKRATTEVANG
jgi:hypothetical protein